MDAAVQAYIDAIAPAQRALFHRIHCLILDQYPDAEVVLSYRMPTYRVAGRSLNIGVWKHGLSFYGSDVAQDCALRARHPGLRASKGTIQVRPQDAADITDQEFREFLAIALG